MKKLLLTCAIITLLSTSALAEGFNYSRIAPKYTGITAKAAYLEANKLTVADKALRDFSNIVLLVDYAQTLRGERQPETVETNPILGEHPSDLKITAYFGTIIVANTFLVPKLPPKWRKATWIGVIIVQTITIIHNQRAGISLRF